MIVSIFYFCRHNFDTTKESQKEHISKTSYSRKIMVAYQKGKRHRVTQKYCWRTKLTTPTFYLRERSFTRFPVCVGLLTKIVIPICCALYKAYIINATDNYSC